MSLINVEDHVFHMFMLLQLGEGCKSGCRISGRFNDRSGRFNGRLPDEKKNGVLHLGAAAYTRAGTKPELYSSSSPWPLSCLRSSVRLWPLSCLLVNPIHLHVCLWLHVGWCILAVVSSFIFRLGICVKICFRFGCFNVI